MRSDHEVTDDHMSSCPRPNVCQNLKKLFVAEGACTPVIEEHIQDCLYVFIGLAYVHGIQFRDGLSSGAGQQMMSIVLEKHSAACCLL